MRSPWTQPRVALWPETVIRLVAELAMAHGRVGRDIERLADGRRKELRSSVLS